MSYIQQKHLMKWYNIFAKTITKEVFLLAKILSQLTVFDYSEIEELGDLERFKLCIDGLDDEKLVAVLEENRGNGRDDYPVGAMLNSIYAMKIFGHKTVESLRRELSRNSQLRQICGWGKVQLKRKHLVPPARVFSNFLKKLIESQDLMDEMFDKLVGYMYEKISGFGEVIAGDGKIIQSFAKKNAPEDEETDRRSETEATWTKKDYYYTAKNGKEKRKSTSYFGYRAHIACDVKTELPIAIRVTPANKDEKNEMLKILDNLNDDMKARSKYVLLDRGYDSIRVHNKVLDIGAKPVIDKRNLWKDGSETRQYKDTDIVYDQSGNVYFIDENSEQKPMKYKGYDKERDALRYEYKGKVYRIQRKEDVRIFTPLARNSKKYKRLYAGRTSVERLNGRLDRDYNFEDHTIRGLEKMNFAIKLSAIIMLSMAKAHIEKGETNYASLYKTG